MKTICTSHGLEGISPLDGQLGLESHLPGRDTVRNIVRADIALMHAADGALFCLDGFRRSPEMDPGTAFEIGFMLALGKPLGQFAVTTAHRGLQGVLRGFPTFWNVRPA